MRRCWWIAGVVAWLSAPLSSIAWAREWSFGDARAAARLLEVRKLDASLRLDVRYARADNFMGRPLYSEARVFLARPAAEAVVRAHQRLRAQGYGLVLFDGYRPWSVTQQMWDETPPAKRDYVADPAKGSRHNRGCAVDLTLCSEPSGQRLEMPTDYDDFSDAAHANAPCNESARRHRQILRTALEREGFTIYPYEWWHYDFRGWKSFPILDYTFSQLDRLSVHSNGSLSGALAP